MAINGLAVLSLTLLALFVSFHNATIDLASGQFAEVSFDAEANHIVIQGRIVPRTLHDFRRELGLHPVASRLVITSLGGEIAAARALGDELVRVDIPVRIRAQCASACVELWAMVRVREIESSALIGLHRSHAGDNTQGARIVASSLEHKWEQSKAVLMRAGFPAEILDRARSTPSSKVFWMLAPEAIKAGVVANVVPIPVEAK